jgi:glucokinase
MLGVDVGGTTTSVGAVTCEGDVLFEEHAPTHGAGPATAGRTMMELIDTAQIRARRQGLRVAAIGVGVPAIVDPATGQLAETHHVPDLGGQRLAERLAERFSLPVSVDNDVNALALGEWRFGAGRGARSLVVLAPGTGFGAGLVLDGRLVRGAAGFGGEFGHAPVKFDGPPCWCGGRGCLAVFASGRGIAEAARARVLGSPTAALITAAGGDRMKIEAPLVFRLAAEGDEVAVAIIDEACQALGAMLGIIVNGLNPEVVIITGGVAAALVPLEARVLRAAGEHAFRRALASTRVRIVPGDKRVTMRGAAALALEKRPAGAGPKGKS